MRIVELNYYALVISILCNCIPETAFEKVQSDKPSKVFNFLTDEDVEDMSKLHYQQGLSFKELGEIYCIDPSSLHRKMRKAGLITCK